MIHGQLSAVGTTARKWFMLVAFLIVLVPTANAVEYKIELIADSSPSGAFSSLRAPSINDDGLLVFWGRSNMNQDLTSIWTASPSGAVPLRMDTSASQDTVSLNNSGTLAYRAGGAGPTSVIIKSTGFSDRTVVAQTGVPGPVGTLQQVSSPVINDSGDIIFLGTTTEERGIYKTTDGTITPVMTNQIVTGIQYSWLDANNAGEVSAKRDGGNGFGQTQIVKRSGNNIDIVAYTGKSFRDTFIYDVNYSSINASGLIVYVATTDNREDVIFIGDENGVSEILYAGDSVFFDWFAQPVINDVGDIVFRGGNNNGPAGLFVGPDWENDRIYIGGDIIEGFMLGSAFLSNQAINNSSQIAFMTGIAGSGSQNAIWLATPIAVPLPAGSFLFSSALFVLGWHRRRGLYLHSRSAHPDK